MANLPELNYHHLRYFWTVAHEGTIAKACQVLKVSQPTISEQLRLLARSVGSELLIREGRRLRLTDTGRLVLDYANEIFALGRNLHEALSSREANRAIPVSIGISDAVSKFIACRLLEPALQLPEQVRLSIHEDSHEVLLQRLASHELDLVISDAPLEAHLRIRAYNHLLGASAIAIFGAPRYRGLAKKFPTSLEGAPMLVALAGSPQRRAWDAWCASHQIHPRVMAEVQDSALLKTLGQKGYGLFAGPVALTKTICSTFDVQVIGEIPEISESYYAISLDRRLINPALRAITIAGRDLFA